MHLFFGLAKSLWKGRRPLDSNYTQLPTKTTSDETLFPCPMKYPSAKTNNKFDCLSIQFEFVDQVMFEKIPNT